MSTTQDDARITQIVRHLQQGHAAAAEMLAREASKASPANAEIARLHGVALLMLDRAAEARTALQEAVRLQPDGVETRSNLASAMLAQGDAEAAVSLLEQVIRDRPHDAALRNNFANALRATGDNPRAREQYLAALRIAPEHLGATLNLAAVELALGLLDDAEARLRTVLAQSPHPQAWLLLGHVLNQRQRCADAQSAYLEGARLVPDAAEFSYQAGLMADEQHHYAEAANLYRRALQLDPNLQLAEGQLLFVLRRLYDWEGAKPLSTRIRARVAAADGGVDPFAFLAEDATPAEQLACAHARALQVQRKAQPLARRSPFSHAPRKLGTPLRVGFMSAGFHAHATALLAVAMFEELGQVDDLELHLFATTPDDGSAVRQRLRTAAHTFHDVFAQSTEQRARSVHDAGIDILVDVDGWCAGGSPGVFALRPAPVQVNWLAYAGSSGAPFIDYLIADRFLIPESSRRFYSEASAYLPRCYQPSDPARIVGQPPPRAAFGLPDNALVFASFNNSWKLNEPSFARMCAVLRDVPGSVLWLLANEPDADARLRAAAQTHGVEPARLVFSHSLPHLEHLARYRHADLFLDTNPYNAHTTASDAIWAGCPVLTCPGETFASRVAGSINHHLGLPELIADSDDAFIATAVRLGNDRAALNSVRGHLVWQRETSGLFDMRAYARDFAALLRAMNESHRKGVAPTFIAPATHS
ncbi:MAG: tetratricopeptide repeat protein [Rhodanobacteraceae bacterium]